MEIAKGVPSMEIVKEVPGDYGLPLIGTFKDRLDFYYFQGEVEYFKSRAKKYKSNVFRVNFVPGPPGFPNPRGVALLDQRCFPVLFDNSKVSKRDVFVGPFKPDDSFNGGTRTLAYLDTSEEKHKVFKEYVFEVLKSVGPRFLSEFESTFKAAFDKLELELKGEYDAVGLLEKLAFDFMLQSVLQVDPSTELGPDGVSMLKTWIGVQFAPISGVGTTGLPLVIEDLATKNFPLPFLLVSSQYNQLLDFFRKHAAELLDMAQSRFKLDREEALHNILFLVGVNGWLGFSKLLPSITYYIGSLTRAEQLRLGSEIRSALAGENASFMSAVDKMELLKSAALEVLRIAPPILYQYGRARDDLIVESYSGKFRVKKGELLGGSQAIVCRDPAVFDRPDEFVVDRFVGEEKSKLAACVFWSNGRNTESTSVDNKQCGAKDFVETVARFYVAQLFLRYEWIELGEGSSPSKPVIKALSVLAPVLNQGMK